MQIHIPAQIPLTLPEQLIENLREVHGRASVDRWLEHLPSMLKRTLDELDARIVPGEPPLSYHLVFFARCAGGDEIVVKCTVPNHEQLPEVAAVQALSDAGIGPRLHSFDTDRGVLIMERINPGAIMPTGNPTLDEDVAITTTLATQASSMAASVDAERWRGGLIPVREYSRAIDEVDHDSSLWRTHAREIQQALELRDEMLSEQGQHTVFLHGDLHHYNVLRNSHDSWTVIDPKGLIGPPGYDFGAFTYNPIGIQDHPELAAIERQRVNIWSEVTGIPCETLRSWGYVAAVLSACWSGESGGPVWENSMRIAITLRDL